jgi:Prenyltransferase and squalene oxidase repeat
MSWQLTSFLILAAVLLGGFAWYERSRPPSQVVALVAALAALAIAGRIAFAAFPNVKPTTDIVVFAGYALGPAPGFAVGALAGLVSNFWFGQGPWTPWQMAGWGMCGVFGAALALGARNAGRFSLAAVCAFAAIAYGLLQNFSLMATYGGDLSIQRFLTLEARAIPFEVAHVAGNVAFALLAGPAMVRMLARFRQRFEWRTPAVATAVLAALLLPALVPAHAAAGSTEAANWLEAQQNDDGGFGSSPGDDSSAAMTGWAMLGLEASGRNPFDVARGGRDPVEFLRGHLDEVSSAGDIARTIVALEGAGANPRSFGGHNLVATLLKRRAANGSYAGWPGTTSFAVIALRSADAGGGLAETISWLADVQNDDGGWGDVPGGPSNADVTGSVMQALPETEGAQSALSYLRKHQRSSGGFALAVAGGVNSQSTAWAAQGMIAIGADPATIESNGRSALDYLAARQADDGHYRYSESSDQSAVWVTGEVLVATAGASLPIAPSPREKTPTTVSPSTAVPSAPSSEAAPPLETEPPPEAPEAGGTGGEALAPPPAASGLIPTTPKEGGGGVPPKATDAVQPAPRSDSEPLASGSDAPSPWAPIGIGVAATALAIALPWWLGRRYAW